MIHRQHPLGRDGHALQRGDRVSVVPIERRGEVTDTDAFRQRVAVVLFGEIGEKWTAAAYVRKI